MSELLDRALSRTPEEKEKLDEVERKIKLIKKKIEQTEDKLHSIDTEIEYTRKLIAHETHTLHANILNEIKTDDKTRQLIRSYIDKAKELKQVRARYRKQLRALTKAGNRYNDELDRLI